MTKEEITEITKHIEIHAKREPRAIHITEILRKAVVELVLLQEENAELKNRNADLEKELKSEKEYSATLRKEIDEYTNSHTLCAKYKELEKAYNETEKLLSKQIEATLKLDKENAELKAKNKWYSEQVCNKECAEVWEELTKAKELIKELYECLDKLYLSGLSDKQIAFIEQMQDKAEQFLKENA